MDIGVRPEPRRPASRRPKSRRPEPPRPKPEGPDPEGRERERPAAATPDAAAASPGTAEPSPPREREHSGSAPPRRSWLIALVTVPLCLLALALTGWVLLTGLGAAPEVSPTEGLFAVRSFAVNRFGFAAAHLPWYDGGLAALQVAAYETVSGALSRTATVVVAAREAMVAACLLTGLSLALAARRLRLSIPATLAAILLAGMPPAAVLLHRTAEPTNLAVLWACAAFALAIGGPRRPGATVGAVCYLVLAVLTGPVVLVAVIPFYAYLLWNGDVGRLRDGGKWLAAIAGLLAWAALVGAIRRDALPGVTRGAPIPPLTRFDVGLLVVLALGVLAAVAVRWLRSLAVGLVGTGAAAAFVPDARVPLLFVGIPLAALLVAAVADAAAGAWRSYWAARAGHAGSAGRRALRLVPAATAAVLVAGVVAAWVPASSVVRGSGTDVSAAKARDWVLASLPTRPRLAVDDALWAELVQAGYPPAQLAAIGRLGVGDLSWPGGWADAAFVAGRDRALLAAPADDLARQAREHSASVAGFGDGLDRVQIRRVLTDPDAVARQAARDNTSRAEAGAALATNPRLRLSQDGIALLRRGDLDARVEVVLAGLAAEHNVDVAAFPAVDGEDDRLPRRLLAVASIDGTPVAPDAVVVTLLEQWLQAQQPPYRPAATFVGQLDGRTVLVVRYDALRQTGLLPQ